MDSIINFNEVIRQFPSKSFYLVLCEKYKTIYLKDILIAKKILDNNIDDENKETLLRIFHRLKGSSLSLLFTKMSICFENLELMVLYNHFLKDKEMIVNDINEMNINFTITIDKLYNDINNYRFEKE